MPPAALLSLIHSASRAAAAAGDAPAAGGAASVGTMVEKHPSQCSPRALRHRTPVEKYAMSWLKRNPAPPPATDARYPAVPQGCVTLQVTHAVQEQSFDSRNATLWYPAVKCGFLMIEEWLAGVQPPAYTGHIGMNPIQLETYFNVVHAVAKERAPEKTVVCDTGFNGGHAAVAFLEAGAQVTYVGFESEERAGGRLRIPAARVVAKALREVYPGRVRIEWGELAQGIPRFFADATSPWCDIISVGAEHSGHAVARELTHLLPRTRRGAPVLLSDCSGNKPNSVALAYANLAVLGAVRELQRYYHMDQSVHSGGGGFCIGEVADGKLRLPSVEVLSSGLIRPGDHVPRQHREVTTDPIRATGSKKRKRSGPP